MKTTSAILASLAIALLATSARAAHEEPDWATWKDLRDWHVESNGKTCMASATSEYNTVLSIGMDAKDGVAILIYNPRWEKLFRQGQYYYVEVQTDKQTWGTTDNGAEPNAYAYMNGGVAWGHLNKDAVQLFAEANTIYFSMSGVKVDYLTLKGSYEATLETFKCLEAMKGGVVDNGTQKSEYSF